MNIAVFGATGSTGQRFCRRALDAGHTIKPYSFSRTEIAGVEELQSTPINLNDKEALLQSLMDVDAVVSAIGGETSTRYTGISNLLGALQKLNIKRIVAIGDAGILSTPTGGTLKEQESFPAFLIPISNAHQAAREQLQKSNLQWTMICPGTMKEGTSQGSYRHQADTILSAHKGVLYDDVAHLILRSLQEKLYVQQRVSVSNP